MNPDDVIAVREDEEEEEEEEEACTPNAGDRVGRPTVGAKNSTHTAHHAPHADVHMHHMSN